MPPMIVKFSAEEAERLSQLAEASGYATVKDYLLALTEQTVNGDSNDEDEIDKATLHADFKQAFKEVLQGKFYTEEEYRRLRSKRE